MEYSEEWARRYVDYCQGMDPENEDLPPMGPISQTQSSITNYFPSSRDRQSPSRPVRRASPPRPVRRASPPRPVRRASPPRSMRGSSPRRPVQRQLFPSAPNFKVTATRMIEMFHPEIFDVAQGDRDYPNGSGYFNAINELISEGVNEAYDNGDITLEELETDIIKVYNVVMQNQPMILAIKDITTQEVASLISRKAVDMYTEGTRTTEDMRAYLSGATYDDTMERIRNPTDEGERSMKDILDGPTPWNALLLVNRDPIQQWALDLIPIVDDIYSRY